MAQTLGNIHNMLCVYMITDYTLLCLHNCLNEQKITFLKTFFFKVAYLKTNFFEGVFGRALKWI